MSLSLLGGVSEITESLLLSSASVVHSCILDKLNVSCVVNCAAELPDPPLDQDFISYHKIPVYDSSDVDISMYFDETADIIQNVSRLCLLFLV